MSWRPGTLLIPCLAAPLLAACGDAGVPDGLAVRDSAGITIVENEPGAMESAAPWAVADSPSLRIGLLEAERPGDSVYQFTRVARAARLQDGSVAVLDAGPNAIRVFGPDGRFVAQQGGRGGGPGEYQSPQGLFVLPGDSLLVFDARQSRITVLAPPSGDSAGLSRARVVTPESPLTSPSPAGLLDDGRLAVQARHRETKAMGDMPEQYLDLWLLSTRDPAAADSLARFPRGREGWAEVPWGTLLGGPQFAPRTRVAAAGDSIIVATGKGHELMVVDTTGAVRRIVRWPGRPLEVTPDHRSAYIALMRREAGDDPARIRQTEQVIDAMGFSDTFAAYDDMRVARSGHVWLRDGQRADQTSSANRPWTVLDPAGRILARITLPEQLSPLAVGEDWVLGRWTDELGVQYVALFDVEGGDS